MKHWMLPLVCALPLLSTLGCGEAHSRPQHDHQPLPAAPTQFNYETAGTIRGTVHWNGETPIVPPIEIRLFVNAANPPKPRQIRDNPNAPVVDSISKGVAGAVVFLQKVDPRFARPWDHPPVTVEHADRRLFVLQGEAKSNIGFVRQGDSITMVSREKEFNALHADGAAFFTLLFPDADKPLTRVLKDQGIVELSSAAGYNWMRAYLMVSDHPYLTRADAKGRFELHQVPPGKYQIVCWMPNWHKKSGDRDPETSLVTRLFFQTPMQVEREVVVEPRGDAKVDFSINKGMFKQ